MCFFLECVFFEVCNVFFWPIISRKFSKFVVDCKCFDATALEQGRNTNSFLGSHRFTGFILAVRMKFS